MNPRLAAETIVQALRGEDYNAHELDFVERVIRACLPRGDAATPVPGTLPGFPPPLRRPGEPAPLEALRHLEGLAAEFLGARKTPTPGQKG